MIELRLRQAKLGDFERIQSFYEDNLHENLPPPPSRDIADTIDIGRLLVLEGVQDSAILACGAIFRLSPNASKTYVGELAGMRVLRAVGGLQPFNAQTLLIGARLLGHAATDVEPGDGRTNSLVAIVKKGNRPSKTNIEQALFHPLEQRPSWFRYDELSWHGSIVADEWSYYYASHATVLHAARLLCGGGLLRGKVLLTRTNRATGSDEKFTIHSELHDIVHAAGDIDRILEGTYEVKLCPPPEHLVF